ncbi:fibronectin type III domain-containing protein [Paenibacillus sp. N3.4]|uniref:fibronectin type III domain-containing protein n=1 Tax=Paenibacillus sp. N3.4 TaxID=2603222 RepID=UPI0021C43A00|nr:fibronectin type III domain-containing protein [Paenibacillus sp. N3.4]
MRGMKKAAFLTIALLLVLQTFTMLPFSMPKAVAQYSSVAATGLPTGWQTVKMSDGSDVGGVSSDFTNGTFTLSASGGSINSYTDATNPGSDNIAYTFMPVPGNQDFRLTARLSNFTPFGTGTNSWALLMLKDGQDNSSDFVAIGHKSVKNKIRDYRRITGTGGSDTSAFDGDSKYSNYVYVRMTRTGKDGSSKLAFEYSLDGSTWTSRTNYSNNANSHYNLAKSTVNVGFAVSSASVVVDNVVFEIGGTGGTGTGANKVFDSNNISGPSVTAPTGKPVIGAPEVTNNSMKLTWSTVTDATYYNVKWGTTSGVYTDSFKTASATNTHTVSGLNFSTPYFFTVSAANTAGGGPNATEVSATTGADPAAVAITSAPANLNATQKDASVSLSWSTVTGAVNYTVEARTASGPLTPVIITAPVTSYSWAGLMNDTPYYFKVKANNSAGSGPYADEVAAMPVSASFVASLPINEDFNNVGTGSIPSGYITSVNYANNGVSVAVDPTKASNKALYLNHGIGDSTKAVSVKKQFTPQKSGILTAESDFMQYEKEASSAKILRLLSPEGTYVLGIETSSSKQIAYKADNATAASLPSTDKFAAGTWQHYKIVADLDHQFAEVYLDGVYRGLTTFTLPANGISAFDSITPGSTAQGHYLDNIQISQSVVSTAPAAPKGLIADAHNGSVTLTWNRTVGVDSYIVKAGTASGNYTLTPVPINGNANNSYTWNGLTNDTDYFFTVIAVNNFGNSTNSTEAHATPEPETPGKPVITSVVPGNGEITIKWSAVSAVGSNPVTYTIKKSTTPGGPNSKIDDISATQITISGLTNGTKYYFVVSAVSGLEGPASNEVSSTPFDPNRALQAPKNLRIPLMAYNENSITLVWEKPDDYGNIFDYNVYMDGMLIGSANNNTDSNSPAKKYINEFYKEDTQNKHVKITMHNFVAKGLTPNSPHTFYVTAVDGAGNESPVSNTVTQSTAPVQTVYNITAYGAVGDGTTINTAAIQAAIDACTPGGKVVVPSGTFKTGPIKLKSDMTLELANADSILLGSENPDDYRLESNYKFISLITSDGANNIRIVGKGKIDGNGWSWAGLQWNGYFNEFPSQVKGSNSNYSMGILAKAQVDLLRGQGVDLSAAYGARSNLITLRRGNNVYVGGITVLNPSDHTLVFSNMKNVTVDGVKILTFEDNNADGIEWVNSDGLTVFNTVFDTGDDSMNFSAGQGSVGQQGAPAQNAWIFNNYFREGHGAIVLGSHTAAWLQHIVAEDNVMHNTDIGLRAKTSPPTGGGARDILFRDNAMKGVNVQGFVFTSDYSDVNGLGFNPAATPAQFKDIRIKNITVQGIGTGKNPGNEAIYVSGADNGAHHEDFHFDNVRMWGLVAGNFASISYMRNSSINDVTFNGLSAPWKIANSSGLTFTNATTMDAVSEDASQAPYWPSGSALAALNVGDTSVQLSWSAARDNTRVVGYKVYDGSKLISDPKALVTMLTFTVTGLAPGSSHSFRIEALDAIGNATSGPTLSVKTTGGSNGNDNDNGNNDNGNNGSDNNSNNNGNNGNGNNGSNNNGNNNNGNNGNNGNGNKDNGNYGNGKKFTDIPKVLLVG